MESLAHDPSKTTGSISLPSREQELVLHRRLLELDPLAPSDFAAAYLDPLISWVVRRNPGIPEEICNEAAEDALLALIRNPGSYQPERQSLEVYLRISAQGDLLNLLRKGKSLKDKQESWESVEQSPEARKYLGQEDDPALPLEVKEALVVVNQEMLPKIKQGLTVKEMAVLDLLLAGERKTEEFAKVLGICHLPKEEMEREVKRVKGKVNKRLERLRERHDQSS